MSAQANTSTLYTHMTIITLNGKREILLDGAILVTGTRISAIGKNETLTKSRLPLDTIIAPFEGRIVIPGLINTYSNLAQSLLRGLVEDLPLHSWVYDAIWPLEASYDVDDRFENVVRVVGES
ncbi:hypothetical protein BJ875DRAFT_445823 [Amylocarpus encephaloides]|uniref:Amidohydrolase-related domain-containing protein n=1 Tax=Amylocarpus encephaloides TaxID=45428 RepID=A0A9P7YAM9_9HELO|nr:hypothetical protein BJ875DRAFT_445823 [Amylocarpus encephaloides]